MHIYYVYITASYKRTTLYVGLTNDIQRRMREHKTKAYPFSFTAKYKVDRLVYYETYADPFVAAARERQLKKWRRAKKVALIVKDNPGWRDLAADWE